jgi:hypothetical protein
MVDHGTIRRPAGSAPPRADTKLPKSRIRRGTFAPAGHSDDRFRATTADETRSRSRSRGKTMIDDNATARQAAEFLQAASPARRSNEMEHFNHWLDRTLPRLLARLTAATEDRRATAESRGPI